MLNSIYHNFPYPEGAITINPIDVLVSTKDRLADMAKFVSEVKLNPEVNRKELIMNIFRFNKKELEMMLFFGMFHYNNDIHSLEQQLNKIRSLSFENFIKEELELLHITDWNGRMCFVVLPEESVRSTIKSVVTHEYHHHWRISALELKEDSETLLDRMVLEGLAEHFVETRLGISYLGPYKDALSETQAKTLWISKYKSHTDDKGTSTDLYMFGNKEKDLPFWGGYSVGYYLIKWYLGKNRVASINDLTLLPSDRFK